MDHQMASILLDATGLMLMLILMVATWRTSNKAAYDQRILSAMMKNTFAINAIDLAAMLMRPSNDLLIRIILLVMATVIHFLQLFVSYEWAIYVDYRVFQSSSRIKGRYGRLLFIPVIVCAVLLCINLFNGMFFRITETGSYQWTPAVMMMFGAAFFYVVYSAVLPIFQRTNRRAYASFPVAVFLIPVLIGNAAHLILEDVSVSWVAMAVAFVSLQLNTQNDIGYMDPLTGLYNRQFLNNHLRSMFERMNEPENYRYLAGILVDLDHFKHLNDTYGHMEGDRALQEVGVILRESLPLDTVACRFGGDEFVVIAQLDKREDVVKIVDNIKNHLDTHNERLTRDYVISMSIGWTIYAKNADTIDTFFDRMDEKMYREKEKHHAQPVIRKKKDEE